MAKEGVSIIIIVGPDSTGKTTLANKLSHLSGYPVYHFSWKDGYLNYLEPLANFTFYRAILDRFFFDEYPYSKALGRKFQFNLKQWHNLILLTLAQNPVIITCKERKGEGYNDPVLPEEKWQDCLNFYYELFRILEIPFYSEMDPTDILKLEKEKAEESSWWAKMWLRGYGGIGSLRPSVLLIAEVLSPLNTHLLPFEAGPSGYFLSECLDGLPLGRVFITNWVKTRHQSVDEMLMEEELGKLNPRGAVLLGAIAKNAIPLLKKREIPYTSLPHPSYICRWRKERTEEYKEEFQDAVRQYLD